MRRNTLITLGVSTVFGGLAIVLARGWINTAVSSQYEQARSTTIALPVKKMKTYPVLVADVPLNFGDKLTPQNVRLVEFPKNAIPEGSFAGLDELFSNPEMPTVALTQIAANEPVLGFKLSGPGGRASLSSVLSDNMRAISIRVNEVSGVAGFVQPGDAVDVFFIQEMEPAKGRPSRRDVLNKKETSKTSYKSTTLVQNIKVLGSDQRSETINNRVQVVKTVTLEVTPAQAQKLSLALRVGELSLSLRQVGSKDKTIAKTMNSETIRADTLTATLKKKPKPRRKSKPALKKKKPTSGVASVIVVRGQEVAQVRVFKDLETKTAMVGGQ